MARSGGTGGGKGRAAKPTRSSLRRYFESALPTLLVVASIILFWEFFNVITGEPEYVLPPLHKILATVVDRAGDRFLPASWVTLQEMLLGFAFGVGSGAVLGTLIFHFKTMRRALLPMVISTQAVPVIAIAPLLIMWFGFGMAPKVIVVALVTFFPVAVNTISGLASVERETINLMHSFGANQRKIFFMVRFPAALPFIFAGIKNAAAISAIGAIVGEWVGAHEGLGPVMIAANAGFKTDVVFAAIFYLAFMAIALFLAVGVVERLAIPWHFMNRSRK
jgi:ABC-type nitrate/sulfonate/bicarbonate transport system permease component